MLRCKMIAESQHLWRLRVINAGLALHNESESYEIAALDHISTSLFPRLHLFINIVHVPMGLLEFTYTKINTKSWERD